MKFGEISSVKACLEERVQNEENSTKKNERDRKYDKIKDRKTSEG